MRKHRLRNPNEAHNERLSPVERFCKRVSDSTGAPIALAIVIVGQFVWIIFGQVTGRDPFPFIFLLTISNVIQLTLLFVISVAQRQASQHAEMRAELDHEWIGLLLEHQDIQVDLLLRIAAKTNADTADLQGRLNELNENKSSPH
jgi:low affinity Fe/Cu permease